MGCPADKTSSRKMRNEQLQNYSISELLITRFPYVGLVPPSSPLVFRHLDVVGEVSLCQRIGGVLKRGLGF